MHLVALEDDQDEKAVKRSLLGEFDDAARQRLCIHELLEHAAKKYSDNIALICGDTTLTFAELNSCANRLARVLVQQGIGNGDLVGVALDRSVNLVAALLAVLKTGAAYVPIEPALPAKRIEQIIDDAGPRLLLIEDANQHTKFIPREGMGCLNVGEILSVRDADPSSINNLGVNIKGDDLAYVMYTSGSTGRPKGVEVSHGNVSNLLLSLREEPGCIETDRLLAITTVSFDMAVLELFLPLFCGATTVMAQRHETKDPTALIGLMERHHITMMQGTPAIWQMLLDAGWRGQPRLGKILCGGEALPRALADRLLAGGDMMWNMYGPTEVTVYASIWRVNPGHDVFIGDPIANGHLYVLDEKLSPVPPGSHGELCVGGAGVARGYHNNSELSRSRFVPNPFHPGKMYRTGDLAHFVGPGKLSVMGRIDAQVKIRGHRVELGDIEAAITGRDDMSGAVVICRDDRLAAYYVRRPNERGNGGELREAKTAALGRLLRLWLSERLPDYMVPAFFVEMSAFPLTANGKVDRNALPDPVASLQRVACSPMPVTELEGKILAIWSRVLGHDRVGLHDSFFEVGGDSVRVIRVQNELQMLLGRPVPSPKLFEHYTVKTLAAHLTSSLGMAGPSLGADRHLVRVVDDAHQDIAIVSMACRLPGGITSPEDLWELLERGGDAITEVPEGRWDATGDEFYCRRGGFLPSFDSFDASFFGISPREARVLDPSQYMMLETCWEGFERAGYTTEQLRGSQTGVFIGTSNILAHQSLNPAAIRDVADLDGYTATGSAGGTMSGRISYQLGLQGPAMTIDTACSSSLVTTHLACNALRQGECDLAVSGGISLMLNPGLHAEFTRLQGMSPDGRCRSFSADAQGTGWSEGSVAIVLKRVSDAQRDGDLIHAVIRGSAVNHDGRSASLTTPSGLAQQRLIHTALTAAGLRPRDVDYVEAHGTGTRLGDPIEATALAEVFGPSRADTQPLLIGSAKSNIGHTQAAAGLVGLLKVTLALHHHVLPLTLHVTKPTLAVDWQRANMTPVLRKQPWLPNSSRPRRAGVSAFGIGGTNAHVIVQEPPEHTAAANAITTTTKAAASDQRSRLLPFLLSGDTDEALRAQAKNLHRHIGGFLPINDDGLGDVAYSLATTRNHLRKRMVLLARVKAELLDKLVASAHPDESLAQPEGIKADEAPRLAMLFSGQGSQWPGMGMDLCEAYPVFDKAIREIAAEFDAELERPLLDVMWADPGSTAAAWLDRTDFAQPALFALEVALWRTWQAWGIAPDFVLGHSLGELVAAHVAGVMDLPDACRLVAARGRLMQARSGHCSMVSLGSTASAVATAIEYLGHGAKVDIALYNTPTQTVISGDKDAVESVASYFTGQGHKTKTLIVGHAFHSRYMDGMLADFRAVAETVRFHPPRLQIISSLDGRLVKPGQLEQAGYWSKQVREPVRFSDSIQELIRHHGINAFLEIGPHQVLCGMGATCLVDPNGKEGSGSTAWLPSLVRHKDGAITLQRALATLHARHVNVDWQAYFKPLRYQRIQLPTYAFQRKRFMTSVSKKFAKIINGTSSVPRGDKVHSHQFEVAWHPANTGNLHPRGTWGVIAPVGASKWANGVITALSRTGSIRLVRVEHLTHAEKLDGLLCLWDSDADVIAQTRHLLPEALAQLQTAVQTRFTPPLVWATRHAVGTGVESDDQAMRPGAGSLLWGLMRTARNEHPEARFRLVDLGQETATGQWILSALMLSAEPECALRRDRVLVPRLQRIDSVPEALSFGAQRGLVRRDGAVLITGGLGHLGARVARWLASGHGVRDLVLTSRHGMEAPGAAVLVAELSRLGSRVTVVASDVADQEEVNLLMEAFSKERPLRGVVHAAGIADSGVLTAMTQQRCETTIAPKAHGAWYLHQSTRDMDLDLFLMFSSVSGVMGMPGLANYAAANTFLDALAHLRRAQGLPATSVAFGTWAGDGGMASRLGHSTRSHLFQYGLDPLPPDEGLELLRSAVFGARALTVAAALDLGRLHAFLEEQGGGIPPFLSLLLARDSAVTLEPLDSRRDLPQVLHDAEPGQHAGIVLNMVRQVVAKALGFSRPLEVEVNRPLKDIGIDSLTAVQMRNHLATLTGLTLSVNIAFLHPNLRALSQSLLSQLQQQDTTQAPAAKLKSTSPFNMTAVRKGCLDSSLTFSNTTTPDAPFRLARRPDAVFLTGATGFVGASILHDLLKQGITTYCLVRASSACKAQQRRVADTLRSYNLWEPGFEAHLEPIAGDMAQPLLGLTEQAFDHLANRVDAVCHSGALVDWMRPLQDYIGPNIVSTHEILRLASCGRPKTVHLVSTISTLPKHMGLELSEGDPEYGYGTSKYLAERLVAAARWRGARACVYRLPYVTASTATGHFRRDRGDFLHNLVAGSLEMGAFPAVDADMSAVLPVDYLAATIAAVMTRDFDRIGRDFDFLNPHAPSCAEFFDLLGDVSGREPKEMMAFGAWKRQALDYAATHPASPLARIAAVLDGYTDETAAAMFGGLQVGEHVFGGEEYPAPLINRQYVKTYLTRMNQSNGSWPSSSELR